MHWNFEPSGFHRTCHRPSLRWRPKTKRLFQTYTVALEQKPTHSVFPFCVFFSVTHSFTHRNNWRPPLSTICTKQPYNRLLCRILFQCFTTLVKKFYADSVNTCVKLQLESETHVTCCSHPFCIVSDNAFVSSPKIWSWLAVHFFCFCFIIGKQWIQCIFMRFGFCFSFFFLLCSWVQMWMCALTCHSLNP